jgi:alpha-glucosidase
VSVAAAVLLFGCRSQPLAGVATAQNADVPPVIAPPESYFQKIPEADRDAARKFYKKYIDVKGMPVTASAEVDDSALQRTYYVVTHLLAGRPDILQTMASNGTRLIIIGKDQRYTDMPEYRHARDPDYLNERVRGTGGFSVTSFGEENLLCLPIDRYDDESIGVHEFCHTIDAALSRIDPTWRLRMRQTYQHAVSNGLWKNAYAGSNAGEYWAEICQAYFDNYRFNNWNHGPIGTREQLKIYDPMGYELIRTTFNLSPAQDWRYHWLQKLPNITAPPPQFKIDPYYTKFTWAREFPVIGRKASDEAMLEANDTVRKMFAYRHDILKALINDGAKLVVLGRNESLSDLPEFKNAVATNVDLIARFADYSADRKLLVVAEENVLGDPNDNGIGSSEVIREFAKALLQVCASRPVDPNWENRGRDVQQYELRLKRLDVQFDDRLKQSFDAAMTNKKWRGTPAIRDRVEYFAEGVLAYFDATGQQFAPNDAPHPIATRELLRDYDPDLFALINETFAYDGHPDWRYAQR